MKKIGKVLIISETEKEIDRKETTEAGVCPYCGSGNLNYGGFQFCDNAGYYDYTCAECEFEGKEWYDLTFSGHQAEGGYNIV